MTSPNAGAVPSPDDPDYAPLIRRMVAAAHAELNLSMIDNETISIDSIDPLVLEVVLAAGVVGALQVMREVENQGDPDGLLGND